MTEPTSDCTGACQVCLRRAWLVAQIGHHLDHHRFDGRKLAGLLDLDDLALVHTVAKADEPELTMRHAAYDPAWSPPSPGIERVCLHDARYPLRLRQTQGAPAVLHIASEAPDLNALLMGPAVAIVGSRKASSEGVATARRLAAELAVRGILVVSGLAVGIDAAAHEGALEAEGRTVSVLPCGADVVYPKRVKEVRDNVLASGALVSELPAAVLPRSWAFPARNRTIAALADVLIVIEAAERSGALSAARLAAFFGRRVGVFPPGPAEHEHAQGTNKLLQEGAHAVTSPDDVLALLSGEDPPSVRPPVSEPPTASAQTDAAGDRGTLAPANPEAELDSDLRELLSAVRAGRDSIGALTASGFKGDKALTGLAVLELKGFLTRQPDGRYVPASAFAVMRAAGGGAAS